MLGWRERDKGVLGPAGRERLLFSLGWLIIVWWPSKWNV